MEKTSIFTIHSFCKDKANKKSWAIKGYLVMPDSQLSLNKEGAAMSSSWSASCLNRLPGWKLSSRSAVDDDEAWWMKEKKLGLLRFGSLSYDNTLIHNHHINYHGPGGPSLWIRIFTNLQYMETTVLFISVFLATSGSTDSLKEKSEKKEKSCTIFVGSQSNFWFILYVPNIVVYYLKKQ